ncbi:hypothetical protein C8R45DRAFT_466928 [Mycena sanguinolenta]|nr:hypothetical protein C8R45DRAFT_466928 [Mycena sanguinolenta]
MFEPHAPPRSFSHPPCPTDQWFSGRPKRECPQVVSPSASSTFLSSTNDLRNWTLASDIWFPVNENVSSSWPPKITFGTQKPSQSLHNTPDAMEGVISQRPKTARTRSATRAIRNRASRSNSLSSIPSMPTDLWRDVSIPKEDPNRLPASSGKCPHATLNPERTRSVDIVPEAGPRSKHESIPCCGPLLRPVLLPSANHISPGSTKSMPSFLAQWDEHERMFIRLRNAQKRTNPHLPLVVSLFNPLRAFMPPLHWKSINTAELNKPFAKIEWNCQRPLPSPALQTKLRSRKRCDAAAERLSTKAFLTGKLQSHCRDCSKDTLLKRLLLVRHWASELSEDALFESALSLIHDDDDHEMGNDGAKLDASFPEGVLLRDRNGFVDDRDWPMDDAPWIDDRDSAAKCYPLGLS